VYVYELVPPDGEEPVSIAGSEPLQTDWVPAMLLFEINVFTVIVITEEVSVQPPEFTTRLNHAVALSGAGE
jgi:hypothetical protein